MLLGERIQEGIRIALRRQEREKRSKAIEENDRRKTKGKNAKEHDNEQERVRVSFRLERHKKITTGKGEQN